MKLIDADKLKDRIQNGYVCLIPDLETNKIIQMIEDSIIKVIDEASTVTPHSNMNGDKRILYINKQQAKDKLLELMGNVTAYGEYFEGIRNAYQSAADILDTLPITELDVEEELGVLKDMPDDEAYYRNGYCTKCKALMPTKTQYNEIKPNTIKFCFNCGAKINGVLWTLIEEGIIKEK